MKLKETIEAALLFQPHVVVTVDSKGFSFRLLKQLQGTIRYLSVVIIDCCMFLKNKYGVGKWWNAFCS